MCRRQILTLYKDILKYAGRFAEDKKQRAIAEARTSFKANMSLTDTSAIEKAVKVWQLTLQRGQAKLSYLKIVTPGFKDLREARTNHVYRDGKLHEIPVKTGMGGMVSPKAKEEHSGLMREVDGNLELTTKELERRKLWDV